MATYAGKDEMELFAKPDLKHIVTKKEYNKETNTYIFELEER